MNATDYMASWAENVLTRASVRLPCAITVVGVCDRHVGPNWHAAEVKIRAEPAPEFRATNNVVGDVGNVMGSEGWLNEVVWGLLDVLLTAGPSPVTGLHVYVLGATIDPIKSKGVAFRLAGRDAGHKILAKAFKS